MHLSLGSGALLTQEVEDVKVEAVLQSKSRISRNRTYFRVEIVLRTSK
jgi:hypothetical protein